jgi:hypothetical protein
MPDVAAVERLHVRLEDERDIVGESLRLVPTVGGGDLHG